MRKNILDRGSGREEGKKRMERGEMKDRMQQEGRNIIPRPLLHSFVLLTNIY